MRDDYGMGICARSVPNQRIDCVIWWIIGLFDALPTCCDGLRWPKRVETAICGGDMVEWGCRSPQ